MSDRVQNPPAFARTAQARPLGGYQNLDDGAVGMSLRDYFAARAMAAILSHPECRNRESPSISQDAYRIADAMLKARHP